MIRANSYIVIKSRKAVKKRYLAKPSHQQESKMASPGKKRTKKVRIIRVFA